MSEHCGYRCDPRRGVGTYECPFTTLYWSFLDRRRDRFERNARVVPQARARQRLSNPAEARVRAAEVLAALDAGTL